MKQYGSEYNPAVLHNQLLLLPVVVATCKKDRETQPQQKCQHAIKNILQPYSFSIHGKQAHKRNHTYTRLFRSFASYSAIPQYSHSIETALNSSPLHLRTTLPPTLNKTSNPSPHSNNHKFMHLYSVRSLFCSKTHNSSKTAKWLISKEQNEASHTFILHRS